MGESQTVEHERQILQYESLSSSRLSWTEAARLAVWFCLRRPMPPLEITAVWIAVSAFFYGWVLIDLASSLNQHTPLLYTPVLACSIATVAALILLYRRRAWAWASVTGIFLAAVLLFSGIVQISHCPHATYLQIFGLSVPIQGDACANVQDARPWWMH